MAMPRPWSLADGGVSLTVRLTPRDGRGAIDGIDLLDDDRAVLKVRVHAAPSNGQANAALCRLIVKVVDVPLSDVALVTGASARIKRLEILGDGHMLITALEKNSS